MKILTAAEMQACDRTTTEQFGVSSIALMRAAAAAVATFVQQQYPSARRVTVLCGRGNNGGDGMMAAHLLSKVGIDVTTLLLGTPAELKEDTAIAWRELTHVPHSTTRIVRTAEELAEHSAAFSTDVILDAIVGTGFTPPLRGLALAAQQSLRSSTSPIVAIDLPSGWAADTTDAEPSGPVCAADAVVTFTAPKPAHVFAQLTRHWDQPIVVAPIGSPAQAMVSTLNLHWAGSAIDRMQTPRPAAANKGTFGHVLIVAGSIGHSGAAAMASLSALRSGAGLVTAAVPALILPSVAAIAPELMTLPLVATPQGEIAAENLEQLLKLMAGKTVLAIGPGMGQGAGASRLILELLAATQLPAVVDADALNILATAEAAKPGTIARLAEGRTLILTPHPGEMARLAATTIPAIQSARLEAARSFATRHRVTVVLKGARTIIVGPDGSAAVNTSGNPGMAKGGSGDVLTGLIAGVLAQAMSLKAASLKIDPCQAVEAAVWLHGLAADLAVRVGDEHTLLATDSLNFLSQAFRYRTRGANGYLWLRGQ